jgi:uncharacterized RDD family membrane protein YckC
VALLLETLLFWLTLCIGWYVWLVFTSRNSATPAKRMLGLVIVDSKSGRAAPAWQVWLREVVWKTLVPGTAGIAGAHFFDAGIGAALSGLYVLTGLLYPLVAQCHRTTWDYLSGTEVHRRLSESLPLSNDDLRQIEDALPSRRSMVR